MAEIVLTAAASRPQTAPEMTAETINDHVSTPEGLAFVLWLLARKHHPEVTPATFKPHLTDETIDVVMADLLEATGLADLDPNARSGSGSPTSPKT